MGVEKAIPRAKKHILCPGIYKEIKDKVSNCNMTSLIISVTLYTGIIISLKTVLTLLATPVEN